MPKKILKGCVTSKKCDKTIHVSVERIVKHPKYGKSIRLSTKYAVHDPENKYRDGDKVVIVESRPISKTKRWIVI